MRRDWLKFLALLVPVLTGCLSHTRSLQKPIVAGTVLNADAVQLVEAVNHHYDQVTSLTATVDFAASVGGAHTGKETDYTSLHGYILFRKPQMLRVIGLVPVVRTHAFDLASDGQTFTLVIPHYNKVIEGSNAVTTRAKNPFENLRPDVFLDAILIRSINPDWIVSLTHSTQVGAAGQAADRNPAVRPDGVEAREPEFLPRSPASGQAGAGYPLQPR